VSATFAYLPIWVATKASNDKRFMLTKDDDDNVAIYDILKAVKLENLGKIGYKDEIKKRYRNVYVPNWFIVNLKTGWPKIILISAICFTAWVSGEQHFPEYVKSGAYPKFGIYGRILYYCGCLMFSQTIRYRH
jgi:WD repeat-containing protein 48